MNAFEMRLALGTLTHKELIAWQTQLERAEEHFYNTAERCESDAEVPFQGNQDNQQNLKRDANDIKNAYNNYTKACKPPAVALQRWYIQKKKMDAVYQQFKHDYMTKPEYKLQREYAAEWRKKNGIKGDGWPE